MADPVDQQNATVAAMTTTASRTGSSEGEGRHAAPSQPQHVSSNNYHVLVEFAHKHLEFLMAELESVLSLHGLVLGSSDCAIVALPNEQQHMEQNGASKASLSGPRRRPYVILSLPETSRWIPRPRFHNNKAVTNTDSTAEGEQTQQQQPSIADVILSRCTLVRSVMELWGAGTSKEDAVQACQNWIQHNRHGRAVYRHATSATTETIEATETEIASTTATTSTPPSWKITIHTLGAKYSLEEQATMREPFLDVLNLPGPVRMKEPDLECVLIREVELTEKGAAMYPRHDHTGQLVPEHDARPAAGWYFGRRLQLECTIGNDRNSSTTMTANHANMDRFSLKKRSYLGPTSMDAQLAAVMTNLGRVQRGSMVLDPFVGTGSILLACALQGAYCVGTDIDIRVLRGKSSDQNVYANFRQFDLPRPELIRSDNALYHRHFRPNAKPMYDAIVCDPPYGIRAGARQTGPKRGEDAVKPILDEHRHDHIAQTKPYAVNDVMADLLDVAARTLVMKGRLVYVIPSFATADFNSETDLPRHDCLQTVHVCYQPLSSTGELGRRMVAMEKVAAYDPTQRDSYLSRVWNDGEAANNKCANIREKLWERAKQRPGYEEKHAYRKQKRKQTRDAKRQAKKKQRADAAAAAHLSTNDGGDEKKE